LKTRIIAIIIVLSIMLIEYLILDLTFEPKIITEIKVKEKIKKEIKEIDNNSYYIYEDKLQVISLLLYNNKYAQIIEQPKVSNAPLAYLFNSHDLTVFYTVKNYGGNLYLKGDYDIIHEFKMSKGTITNNDMEFEKTDLTSIYERIERAKLLYESTISY
jgi:hypothetical protein